MQINNNRKYDTYRSQKAVIETAYDGAQMVYQNERLQSSCQ